MIRAISLTLVAAAALAASVTMARTRQPERRVEPDLQPGHTTLPDAELDAIRAAGL